MRHPRIVPCVRVYQLSLYVFLAVLIFSPPVSFDCGWSSLPLTSARRCKCSQLRSGHTESRLPGSISRLAWFCPKVSMNKEKNPASSELWAAVLRGLFLGGCSAVVAARRPSPAVRLDELQPAASTAEVALRACSSDGTLETLPCLPLVPGAFWHTQRVKSQPFISLGSWGLANVLLALEILCAV